MDIMPAMLERARALSRQLPITRVQADCRTFHLAQQFRCVLMTGHAFQNLLTDADQHAFLAQTSEHIAVGGILLAWQVVSVQAPPCHGIMPLSPNTFCLIPCYAQTGIPEVWLIDVEQETVTQYSHPDGTRYRRERSLPRGQRLVSDVMSPLHISVDDIFG
jgi:hypothetical protein